MQLTFGSIAAAAFPLGGAAVLAAGLAAPSVQPKPQPVDVVADVLPILRAHCMACHGEEKAYSRLRLDSVEGLKKGGIAKNLIIPGDPKASVLLQRIKGEGRGRQMPLGFAPLSAEKTKVIEDWIAQGASMEGRPRPHWAYQPVERPRLPDIRDPWIKNTVDAFVLDRLNREGLKPSPPAEPAVLARRLAFDLNGLPPTPAQVDAFLKDRSRDRVDAFARQLMASPHYGERMAMPWLDLARYADSNGYEKDAFRSIWPYRDWVISAFNRNLSYADFVRQQLAGDMLPEATMDTLVATGFQRNTMYNEEGGVDKAEQRWLTLVDRVAVTGQAFLATSIQCAQCHDHKYDPTSQTDFFRMLAFYESSEEPSMVVHQDLREPLAAARDAAEAALNRAKGSPEEKAAKEAFDKAQGALSAFDREHSTLILKERKDAKPETLFRIRGTYLAPGDMVQSDTPHFLPRLDTPGPKTRRDLAEWIVAKGNPLTARVAVNRLWEMIFGVGLVKTSDDFGLNGEKPSHPELLDWLANELMDQDWNLQHVLRLIVGSATYQQSSAASAALREKDPENRLLARGPRFRLPAEMIRDSALKASGLLSAKVGGPSVMPDQPEGIWNLPYSGEYWAPSQGDNRWRRGLYTHWKRSAPYPAFMAFDATSREACTTRRINTNTPLQALNLLNDVVYLEAARALAASTLLARRGGGVDEAFRRVLSRRPTKAESSRLKALMDKLREQYTAKPEEASKLAGPLAKTLRVQEPGAAAAVMVCHTILNLDEAITKE